MSRRLTMVQQARAYLEQRHTLGFDLRNIGKLVLRFAKFVDRSGHRGPLKANLIQRWVQLPKYPTRHSCPMRAAEQ